MRKTLLKINASPLKLNEKIFTNENELINLDIATNYAYALATLISFYVSLDIPVSPYLLLRFGC